MTQEDKDLLLKDLLGRLPYGVKVLYEEEIYRISMVSIYNETITICGERGYPIEVEIQKVKPYLFPLESMTEGQLVIYGDLCYAIIHSLAWDMQAALNELVDWLNENHFDYNNLIPKGLAIDATGLNIY